MVKAAVARVEVQAVVTVLADPAAGTEGGELAEVVAKGPL